MKQHIYKKCSIAVLTIFTFSLLLQPCKADTLSEFDECKAGLGKQCLNIILRNNGTGQVFALDKLIKILAKDGSESNAANFLIAGYFQDLTIDTKTVKKLEELCDKNKNTDSCFVLLFKKLKKKQKLNSKELSYKKIVQDSCDMKSSFSCVEMVFLDFLADNPQNAIFYIEQACKLGDYPSCYTVASDFASKNKLADALKIFADNCRLGIRKACVDQGHFYQKQNDILMAKAIFTQYCELGQAESCIPLGAIYLFDEKNSAEAEKYFKLGCNLGDSVSCYFLAKFIEIPHEKIGDAKVRLKSSCAEFYVDACNELGKVNETISDFQNAAEAYSESCNMGSGLGCVSIYSLLTKHEIRLEGKVLNSKKSVPYLKKGMKLLKTSCDNGSNYDCALLKDYTEIKKNIKK